MERLSVIYLPIVGSIMIMKVLVIFYILTIFFLERKFKDSNCFKINIMKNKSLSWHKVLDNYIPDKGKQLLYKKDIMYIAKVQLTKLTHRGYTNLTIEKIFNYLESKYDKIGKKIL